MATDEPIDLDDDEFLNDPHFLATLDQLESRFSNSQLAGSDSHSHSHSHLPPPLKRQKQLLPPPAIIANSNLQSGSHSSNSKMDYDGPDVFIDQDGIYQLCKSPVQPSNAHSIRKNSLAHPQTRSDLPNVALPTSVRPQAALHDPPSRRTSAPLPRPSSANRQNPSANHSTRPSTISKHPYPQSRTNSNPKSPKTPLQPLRAFQSVAGLQRPPSDAQDDQLARLKAEIDHVRDALKQANVEKTRLKGEVSIVRSSLDSHRAKSSKQVHDLKQREEQAKLRAEQAEKEVQRLKNQREVHELFKGLEESAKKPPGSTRKNFLPPAATHSQGTPSQRIQPQRLFNNFKPPPARRPDSSLRVSGLQNHQNPSEHHSATDPSQFAPPPSNSRSGRPTSPRPSRPQEIESESIVIDDQSPEEPVPCVQPEAAEVKELTEPSPPEEECELQDWIIVNLFQNFIINMIPEAGVSSTPSLQKILQARFDEPDQQAHFNRLVMDLFVSLSRPLDNDWEIVKEGEERVMKFVTQLGLAMVEIVKLLGNCPMQEALPVAISLLNTLCQTTPLFCSLFLNHPDFGPTCDIVPTLVKLIERVGGCENEPQTDLQARAAENVLELIESLVWDPAEVCYPTLETLLRSDVVFERLLDTRQPSAVLSQALSILTSLSCKPQLCSLIPLIPLKAPADRQSKRDPQRRSIALVERLVGLLSIDAHLVRLRLLRLLLLLGLRIERGFVLLGQSSAIISMLIRTIAGDCVELWNGDGGMSHRIQIPLCVDRIELAIELVFQIVSAPEPGMSLMDRLQEATRRFPGIHHEFVVAFGKLTFSDLPATGFLNKDQLARLDTISEMAYELLRTVASPDELQDWQLCSADDSESSSPEKRASGSDVEMEEEEHGEIFM